LQDKEAQEKLARIREEKSLLESQLAKYRKAYPRFPDMKEEEAYSL
jgi:hypothetical protein